MGTVMQTPLDSTHNQEENLKPQEKSFSQEQELHPDLYMLETVFQFSPWRSALCVILVCF